MPQAFALLFAIFTFSILVGSLKDINKHGYGSEPAKVVILLVILSLTTVGLTILGLN